MIRHSAWLAAALLSLAAPVLAQGPANVAVVVNDASPDSIRVGQRYAETRRLPPENVLHLRTATAEQISRAAFVSTIEAPLATLLSARGLQDSVFFLVLTRGVPLRISGSDGARGTTASVDSELTLLYRRMTGVPVATAGPLANPYFLGTQPIAAARRFSHETMDIFLVTRLDGFSLEDALALIERASAPRSDGRIVLDQKALSTDRTGNTWLREASERLEAAHEGPRVAFNVRAPGPAIGYYGWGSNDALHEKRGTGLSFLPGSIGGEFVSTDARTMQPPPQAWHPSLEWKDKKAWFAGSPQSLIGDLIREGLTGVSGYVAEPYLAGTVRPQVLFPSYLRGFTLAEAFYLAMPHVSWEAVVIGDPLCRPFPSHGPEPAVPGTDSVTELPSFFSVRRIAAVQKQLSVPPRVAALALRAERKLADGDRRAAIEALQESVALAPGAAVLRVQLALALDVAGKHDDAIAAYRAVLQTQPRHAMALNNLAYDLAEYKHAPQEARPLARRALALLPKDPTVLDTVGWIEHLIGNDAEGVKYLTAAAAAAPTNADVRMHAATVLAKTGQLAAARRELDAVLGLQASWGAREDVKRLQRQLAGRGPAPK